MVILRSRFAGLFRAANRRDLGGIELEGRGDGELHTGQSDSCTVVALFALFASSSDNKIVIAAGDVDLDRARLANTSSLAICPALLLGSACIGSVRPWLCGGLDIAIISAMRSARPVASDENQSVSVHTALGS